MKRSMIFVMVCLIFYLNACSCALKYTEVDPWLASQAGSDKAKVDVSGVWEDVNRNQRTFSIFMGYVNNDWGKCDLEQKGRDVTGNLDTYIIKGIVSGDTLFMVLMYANTPYYLAKLDKINNKLTGTYYYPKDKKLKVPYPMTFKKVE
jgi:hypothetical protein